MAEVRALAAASGRDVVDLSVGAPTDPSPAVVRRALAEHADAPGYPLTIGRPGLREAYVGWLGRVHGVTGLTAVNALPTVGSKELIGGLAVHLGLTPAAGPVGVPALAYPTYAVGARFGGFDVVTVDTVADLRALGRAPALLWVNSPSNPTGRVLDVAALRDLVDHCRAHGTLLVSDECYLDLGWDARPVSVLHPDVCGGTTDGLLAVHSLSKRSNLAGYRCGFVAGDEEVVGRLAAVRRDLGLIMPAPQQAASIAALDDDAHVADQRERYAARRSVLAGALTGAGFRIDHSEAGLYLWATRDEHGADTAAALADVGVVVVPGVQYGPTGDHHVRLALTATDADIDVVAARLLELT